MTPGQKIEVIEKANQATVLMRLLCREIGITTKCTHIQFVEAFSKLQTDSKLYEMEFQEVFKNNVLQENKQQPE